MKIEVEKSFYNRSKQLTKLIGFIVVSIIIHALLTLGFFQYGFHKRAMSWIASISHNLTPEEQKDRTKQIKQKRDTVLKMLQEISPEKKDSRPAMLRAPKSQFGWVLFDEPTPAKIDPHVPVQIPTTLDGSVMHASTDHATEQEQAPGLRPKVASDFAKAPTDRSAGRQDESLPKLKSKSDQLAQKSKMEIVEKAADIEKPMQTPSKKVAQRIADIKGLEAKPLIHQEKSTTTQSTQQQSTIHVRGAQSIDQKPKRNIIALTKGFVEKLHGQEGTDLVDRDGDPNKMPSLEELKYLSYESKINWCLQASWKQNFCYQRTRGPIQGDVTIEFTLDEHGNLTNCNLLQSSGYTELDTIVMRNMKVASPFPPIPKHFGFKTYTTRRIITVYSNHPTA